MTDGIFYFLRYGRGSAPMWVTTLQLAEKWHVPPWEIREAPGALKWANRQAALDQARERIDKIEAQKNKKR